MNEKRFENNQFLASLYSDAVQYALNQRFSPIPSGPRSLQSVINEKFAELIINEFITLTRECSGKVHPDDLIGIFTEHFGIDP